MQMDQDTEQEQPVHSRHQRTTTCTCFEQIKANRVEVKRDNCTCRPPHLWRAPTLAPTMCRVPRDTTEKCRNQTGSLCWNELRNQLLSSRDTRRDRQVLHVSLGLLLPLFSARSRRARHYSARDRLLRCTARRSGPCTS